MSYRLTGFKSDPISSDQLPIVKVWLQGRIKYRTGFCVDGHCEGTKPKTRDGRGIKTCDFIDTCPCLCHYELDQMFKLAEQPRVVVDNPLYTPERVDFNIEDYVTEPEIDPVDVPSTGNGVTTHNGTERPSTGTSRRDMGTLAATRTETGRAARGGLEAQVLDAVNKSFEADKDAVPRDLADYIAVNYKVPTPSTGAIGAVFNRWEQLGFAVQARKPVRLVDWAEDFEGTWEELERLKAKKKREKKNSQREARHGIKR